VTSMSEDALKTLDGWLRYQAIDPLTATTEELEKWRGYFEEVQRTAAGMSKVGQMQLRPSPGQHLYAVAVRNGTELWLTLWVRRSLKGEFFVFQPRADRSSNHPHTSYHLDGTLHVKIHGLKTRWQRRQPLSGKFSGTEHLGVYGGHGPRTVGAICDPLAFTGIVEVANGILGPRDGSVAVDLVEPGCEPIDFSASGIITRRVFRDAVPWVVITVLSA
jgi:hypothetical protein